MDDIENDLETLATSYSVAKRKVDSLADALDHKGAEVTELESTLNTERAELDVIQTDFADGVSAYIAEQRETFTQANRLLKKGDPLAAAALLGVDVESSTLDIGAIIEQGEAFYARSLPEALRLAQDHAGENVATLPELLQAKISADKEHELWCNRYSALSEEAVGLNQEGEPVVVVVHGGGVLSTPERLEQALAHRQGLAYGAARLEGDEFPHLLEGMVPDGTSIPVYSGDQLMEGIPDLGRRYAVVIPFEEVRNTPSGRQDRETIMNNPLAVARAGGPETLEQYFEKANYDGMLGNWHLLDRVDPSKAAARVLFADGGNGGLYGNYGLVNDGRFLGVAPEARRARK